MKLNEKPNLEVPAYTGEGNWPTQIVRGDAYYQKMNEMPDGSRAWYTCWSKLDNDVVSFVVMWLDRSGKTVKKSFDATKGMYSRGWDRSEEFYYSMKS